MLANNWQNMAAIWPFLANLRPNLPTDTAPKQTAKRHATREKCPQHGNAAAPPPKRATCPCATTSTAHDNCVCARRDARMAHGQHEVKVSTGERRANADTEQAEGARSRFRQQWQEAAKQREAKGEQAQM